MKLNVIKVGGAVVEDKEALSGLLSSLAALQEPFVLVHGGGRAATAMSERLGIETKMVGGRRITDADMLEVVTMVYGGLVNKRIVASLQALGVNAIGICGADLDCIRSVRRPVKDVDYGFVGDVKKVNGKALSDLVLSGAVPVVAPLTHDGCGQILNTNADTIASSVARGLAEYFDVTLTFCFEKEGVLDADGAVIPLIDRQSYKGLVADGTVSGGMLPKLDNAFAALECGVREVVITKADALGRNAGTRITD